MRLYMAIGGGEARFDGVDPGDGGVRQVIAQQRAEFPDAGIEVVDSPQQADMLLGHIFLDNQLMQAFSDRPIVVDNHGLYWAEYEWPAWALKANQQCMETIRQADAVIAHSDWVAQSIKRHTMRDVRTVPHGIDLDQWPVQDEHMQYVLWNKTRVDPVCDPEPLMRVAELLPNVQFITTFVPENQRVTPSNVQVVGRLPFTEAQYLVQRAGLYLCTTRETFGVGTLEAMASGVPVVGYRWGAQREFITHEENGWLCAPGDDELLAEGITWALENRQHLSDHGRDLVEDQFESGKVAAQYAVHLNDIYDRWTKRTSGPRTTILVTSRNLARYLPDCLNSVQAQTDGDWECIIVDDASTDDTSEVATQYATSDMRFRLVRSDQQLHVSGARNLGVREAKGQYILPLDADDKLTRNTVEILATALNTHRNYHVVYGNVLFVDEDGVTPTDYKTKHGPGHSGWPVPYRHDWQEMQRNCPPYASMFRYDAWALTGGERTRLHTAEDADLWLRMSSYGFRPAMVTEADTLIYRNRAGSLSRSEAVPQWANWFPWRYFPELRPAGAVTEEQQPIQSCDPPLVAVVIPVGPAHRELVRDAIDSVDAQTFRQWECIVVNDSGTPFDRPLPSWVTVIDTDGGYGVARARNAGIARARARLCLPLDADDYLQPECLKLLVSVWQKELEEGRDQTIIYSDWYDESEPGKLTVYETPWYNAELLTTSGCIHAVTALYPTKLLRQLGGFDTELTAWEDWGLQLAAAEVGVCSLRVPRALWVYRKYTGSRREENFAAFEQGKRDILAKYGDYFDGGKQLMGCGTCGQQAATPPPSAMGGGSGTSSQDLTVLIEYTGAAEGKAPLRGPSGQVYFFGGGPDRNKYVREQDVEFFLAMLDYKRIDREPITEEPEDGPALMAEAPPLPLQQQPVFETPVPADMTNGTALATATKERKPRARTRRTGAN